MLILNIFETCYDFSFKIRKEGICTSKRRNIFVDALELLGYLIQVEEGRYLLNMDLDSEALVLVQKRLVLLLVFL